METADKLISVIVPVYKVEQYLNKCVESIVNQTYKNLEIILVDDGSPDACPQICDAWAQKDSRIKVIHKENGGVSSARNAGLDAATGEYVAFVDGDDYLSAETYETLVSLALKHGADIVRCGIVRESLNGYQEIWGSTDALPVSKSQQDVLCDLLEAQGILSLSPCNKLYSAEVIGALRFDQSLGYAEDLLFNFYVAKNIRSMVYFDRPFYHYLNNASSASHHILNEKLLNDLIVSDIFLESVKSDQLLSAHAVKGDVSKCFKLLKLILVHNQFLEYFPSIRKRILQHKKIILKSSMYSYPIKILTVLLWLSPTVYKWAVRIYGRRADREYLKNIQ